MCLMAGLSWIFCETRYSNEAEYPGTEDTRVDMDDRGSQSISNISTEVAAHTFLQRRRGKREGMLPDTVADAFFKEHGQLINGKGK